MYVFPKTFLKQLAETELCIGLNQAWKYTDKFKLNISIHPELIAEAPHLNWITKIKGTQKLPWDSYFLFKNNKEVTDLSLISSPKTGQLYVGRGIHTAAIVLAAQMGCKYIVLIGVDCNDINNIHHGHEQHTQFHGQSPQVIYREYYENVVLIRNILYEKYQAYVVSMNAFVGCSREVEETQRLKELYQLPALPPPKDIPSYHLKRTEFIKEPL